MSTPFIITTLATGTVEPVNIENLYSIRKENPTPFNGGNKYSIAFYKNEQSADHNAIKWKYDDEETRDCDYQKIIANFAVDINTL